MEQLPDEIWSGCLSWIELRSRRVLRYRECPAQARGIYLAPVSGSCSLRRDYFAGGICLRRLFADWGDCAIFAGDEIGGEVRVQWRDGAGYLQWVPDFAGGWVTAWGDDAEFRAALHLPACAYSRGGDGYAVYERCQEGTGSANSDRA